MLQQNKQNPALRRQMFVATCYLYIFLGACCLAGGIGLLFGPLWMGGHLPHIDLGLGFVLCVLFGFGLARIVVAVTNLRRLRKTSAPR